MRGRSLNSKYLFRYLVFWDDCIQNTLIKCLSISTKSNLAPYLKQYSTLKNSHILRFCPFSKEIEYPGITELTRYLLINPSFTQFQTKIDRIWSVLGLFLKNQISQSNDTYLSLSDKSYILGFPGYITFLRSIALSARALPSVPPCPLAPPPMHPIGL